MPKKYNYNNVKKVRIQNRFKCTDCEARFPEFKLLRKHAEKYHKDIIGNYDIDRYLYEQRNPGPYICGICGKNPRSWNNETKKYNRLCDSEICHKIARERFSRNMKKIYGTDNLCADPEHQAAMLANRKISGIYKFKDGSIINYVGKYELDFLRHTEEVLNLGSLDLIEAPSSTYIKYFDTITNTERFYIPDFFIPKYNLVIEIKDGSKFPVDSKLKTAMKEKAVVKNNKYNYIKIVDKNYEDYDNLIDYFSKIVYDESKNRTNREYIFIIPENTNKL